MSGFSHWFDPSDLYYDRQGHTISMWQWATYMEDSEYRRIGSTDVGKVHVSTVWLGLNHSFMGGLLIFETMVFGGIDDQCQERYGTEAEAQLGHAHWVKRERRLWTRVRNARDLRPWVDVTQTWVGALICLLGVLGGFITATWWWIVASFVGGILVGNGFARVWRRWKRVKAKAAKEDE